MQGVLHHLLGGVDLEVEYIAHDFCLDATTTIEQIINFGKFKSEYRYCFIWINSGSSRDEAVTVLGLELGKRVLHQSFNERIRPVKNYQNLAEVDDLLDRSSGVKAEVMSDIFHVGIDSPKQMAQHILDLHFNNIVQQNANVSIELDLVRFS
nr:adenylate isopentenyltransferase 5, chloroplastic-like [Ipomoea batatas]